MRTAPLVAVLFLLPALSLAGIPPFSGFVAKFAVLDASAESGEWVGFGAAIAVGFLTLFSMFKIWIGAFWGQPTEALGRHRAPGAGDAVGPPGSIDPGLDGDPHGGARCGGAVDRSVRRSAVSIERAGRARSHRSVGLHPIGAGRMSARRSYVLGLAAVWVLLWGTASPANVLGGLAVGTVLVLLLPGLRGGGRRPVVRPRAAAAFLWTILLDTVRSNVRLTKAILSGRRDVESSIIEIDIPICSDQLLTTIANLLAVVPGTMPLEVHGSPATTGRARAPSRPGRRESGRDRGPGGEVGGRVRRGRRPSPTTWTSTCGRPDHDHRRRSMWCWASPRRSSCCGS